MKQHIQELIEKFWAGKLNAAERKSLFEQLQAYHPEWLEAQEKLYQQSLDTEQPLPVEDPFFKTQYALLLQKVEAAQNSGSDAQDVVVANERAVKKSIFFTRLRTWSAAAAVLVLAVSVWYLYGNKNSTEQTDSLVNAPVPAAIPLHTTISNTTDSIQQHWLSDGSLIRLQAGSRISYNKDFGRETRSVQLTSGQVYFLVAKDKAHPFIVSVGNTLVRAVGTAFTVTRNDATRLSVVMEEGSVAVTADSSISQSDIMLSAGDELNLDLSKKTFRVQNNRHSSRVTTLHEAAPENKPVSKKIKLPAFRQAPLQQVFEILSKSYQVNIRFDSNEMEGLWFTGEFTGRETLASILATICRMNQLEIQFEENEFLIKKK